MCLCVWVAYAMVLFSACGNKDNTLFKKMEGTWIREEQPKKFGESSMKRSCEIQLTKYERDVEGFYGPYKEIQRVHYIDAEDDSILSYTLSGTITGQWKIVKGDLYISYLVSSLEVTLSDFDFKWKDGNEPPSQSELNELAEEYKDYFCPKFYQELTEDYQSNDDTEADFGLSIKFFHDVEIKHDILTFMEKMDMVTFHRLKE